MTHPNNIAYQQFSKLFVEANKGENKSKQLLISEAMVYWKTYVKKSSKDPIDQNALSQKIKLLKDKIETRKRRNSIQFSFLRQRLASASPGVETQSVPQIKKLSPIFVDIESNENETDDESNKSEMGDNNTSTNGEGGEVALDVVTGEDLDDANNNRGFGDDQTVVEDGMEKQFDVVTEAVVRPTPKQDSLQDSINSVNSQILKLQESSRLSILDDETKKVIKNKIEQSSKVKKKLEKQLRRVKQNQKHQKKFTVKKRRAIKMAIQQYPEIAPILKGFNRDRPGNPRIECDQPEILEEILKIAEIGSACSDRRRDNTIRTVRTLNQLKEELHNLGFQVSRSGLYLKLLPRDANTTEGRRHVETVPVKLTKPQNNLRKGHKDRIFAKETCKAVDEIAHTLGPEACIFLSQDDKSQVGIGITCAKRQAPMLMSMSQKVRLPDHDFVLGSRQKLTPSVIGMCEIDPDKGVTYSGLTYVSIRSSKHNNSSALTHIEDLRDMIAGNIELFESDNDDYKPVLIKSVDGGPDENPRFEKNILAACQVKKKYDFDAVIEVTNAPGLSAFNRVERRMHPLSLSMAGVILPHDTCGTHLDSQGNTVDVELEKENFAAAGGILADVFNNITIDGHEVQARYVKNPPDLHLLTDHGGKYRNRHVIETQYLTAVLSCDDRTCCPPVRTSILSFFPGRRIPALIPIVKTERGPLALEMDPNIHKKKLMFPNMFCRIVLEKNLMPRDLEEKYNGLLPYDAYFPTLQEKVEARTCKFCMKYHSSKKSLNRHLRYDHS